MKLNLVYKMRDVTSTTHLIVSCQVENTEASKMMIKTIVILAVIALVAAEDEHTTLDDQHDLEVVVNDPARLKEYNDCFIERGPCSELTQSFKKNMPVAVPEACARCNSGQKKMFRTFLDGLKKNDPQGYKDYAKFYDPNGDKMGPLEKELSKY